MVKLSIAKMAIASKYSDNTRSRVWECSSKAVTAGERRRIQGVAAPLLAPGGYSAKTSATSTLPHLVRYGTAKYGPEAAALPHLPHPLNGDGRWGGAVGEVEE